MTDDRFRRDHNGKPVGLNWPALGLPNPPDDTTVPEPVRKRKKRNR